MSVFALALGSNLGDRRAYLERALQGLRGLGEVLGVGPCFETPPMLPEKSPADWYSFYLNSAVLLKSDLAPKQLLERTKAIETELGRDPQHEKWSPRPIDIDILFDNSRATFDSPELRLPHPHWQDRSFVLAPLCHLLPSYAPAGERVLKLKRRSVHPVPALMAVLNVTPDSFSEKQAPISQEDMIQRFDQLLADGASFIDVGAESTRPGATPLTPEEEWERLQPVLDHWKNIRERYPFTKVSLDTYHPQTAARALDFKVDILNDVKGLEDPAMVEVAGDYESVIFMHSLSVPASKDQVLDEKLNVADHLKQWAEKKIAKHVALGLEKLIFDPGLGFGKTPLQSLSVLRDMEKFRDLPVRILVGHSRKSFMNLWSQNAYQDRDIETLGASLFLAERPVEILRVHNLSAHQRALRTFNACQDFTQ